jgi:hypothetical protein|tara:strand:+ start:994 stop:2577 length:1584 start_codon:yes stop_codon:yes gene_type:complete
MANIKEIIKQEYLKCAENPTYFMKKYCWIQHPTRGRIQFNLFPFQEGVLKLLQKNDRSIILKSRQLGISTLSAGISLWMMIFQKDKAILVVATKQDTAKNLVTKVKFMYDELPSWLQLGFVENNKLALRLKNGSQIKAVSAAGDAGRSEAISLLIIDEAAFIETNKIDEIWGSSQQTLSTGGKAIVLSTPNGTGNFFHKMWVRAEENRNGFVPIRLPWTVHPERNQAWRDKQDDELGLRMAAQECDCDFSTSGNTVYDVELLKYYEQTFVCDPVEKRGIGGDLHIWEYPDYSRNYMIVADVARGDSKDFSAFHIIDIENAKQIGEFKAQIGTKEYGHMLVAIATEYNNALLVIENANIGWNTIQVVIDKNYPRLYYSPKGDAATNVEAFLAKGYDLTDTTKMTPGFTMSMKTRPLTIGKLDAYLREKSIIIQGKRTLEEMRTFIWKNGRPEAQSGYNDDLVMSLATGCYVRDTALKFAQQGIDITNATLKNWQREAPPIYTSKTTKKQAGWTQDMGEHGDQDLTWLL